MAQYFNDFSGETIGALPAGASLTRSAASGNYSVQLIGGVNQLRYLAASGGAVARGMKYGFPSSGVTEVFSVITEPANTSPQSARLVTFATDAPDNEYGAILDFTNDTVNIYKRVAGSLTSLANVSAGTLTNSTYYCVRLRVTPGTPNTIQARVWGESAEEPGTWTASATDSALTLTTGWTGHVGFAQSQSVYFKEIGIGTDGDAAPTAPLSGGGATTSDASPAAYTTTASAATASLRSAASPASYATAASASTSTLTSAAPPTAYALSAQGSTSTHTSVAPPASYALTVLDATGTIGFANVVSPAAYALTAFDATTVLRSRADPASYVLTAFDATGALAVPLSDSEKIDLILDILSNRQVLNPATGVFTLYADDGVTVLKTALAWEDAAGTIPYRGQALRRLDAME